MALLNKMISAPPLVVAYFASKQVLKFLTCEPDGVFS